MQFQSRSFETQGFQRFSLVPPGEFQYYIYIDRYQFVVDTTFLFYCTIPLSQLNILQIISVFHTTLFRENLLLIQWNVGKTESSVKTPTLKLHLPRSIVESRSLKWVTNVPNRTEIPRLVPFILSVSVSNVPQFKSHTTQTDAANFPSLP